MRFRLFEVSLFEHSEAHPFAAGLILSALERQAVMRTFLNAAQVDRSSGLVTHLQADHFGVEIAAFREVARGQHQMARARDIERRFEIGLRQAHAVRAPWPKWDASRPQIPLGHGTEQVATSRLVTGV